MKSHEHILNAFSEGSFSEADGMTPKCITTAISNLFVFDKTVYKIYRQDADFFNKSFYDLSDKIKRFQFTHSDFEWNRNLCKEVYTKIVGLSWLEDKIHFVTPDNNADELVIVMNRIDMTEGVFPRLLDKTLTADDCYEIGFQLGKQISLLPPITDNGVDLYSDFIVRHKDVVEWLPIAKKYISKEEADSYCNFLRTFIDAHKNNLEHATGMFGIGIDMHSENAVFTANRKLLTIDTYPPKEDWRRGYKHINIYRLATDIYALFGEEGFKSTLKGYTVATGEVLDAEYEGFLVMYSALVMVPYLYMLGEKDELRHKGGVIYHNFLKNYFQSLNGKV